jgi:hypothetical protein
LLISDISDHLSPSTFNMQVTVEMAKNAKYGPASRVNPRIPLNEQNSDANDGYRRESLQQTCTPPVSFNSNADQSIHCE